MKQCMSCDQQRDRLTPYASKLFPFMTLIMCRSCIRSGYEPRWLIILKARNDGLDTVKPYLADFKYKGEKISADELV